MANNKLQLYIRSDAAMDAIEKTIGDRKQDFVSSLLSVANNNPLLQNCDPGEVIKAALKAASMRLPIDPNLGFAYIIPYKNGQLSKKLGHDVYDAQFQVGYKGFIQLALRSGEYRKINVTDVREGEYIRKDRESGEIEFAWVDDDAERNKLPVIGYLAYFKLHSGFEQRLYMTVAELTNHAKTYSQNFKKWNSGKWADDFAGMSRKTVLKLLISKWGPLSTELQIAMRADQAALADDDAYRYVDNDKDGVDAPAADDTSDAPHSDAVEGEVVGEGTGTDTEKTDAPEAMTPPIQEAEAPVGKPLTVKEKAAKWAAEHKAPTTDKE